VRHEDIQAGRILDFLPDATFVIDRHGIVLAWNPAMEEITGMPASEVVGEGDYVYALPFYGFRRPMLANLILMPEDEFERQYSHVEREGDTLLVDTFIPTMGEGGKYFWAKASPILDEAGEVVGAIETVRDITERVRGRLQIADSRRRLTEILDFLPDATFVIDREGVVLAWNRAMAAVTGVAAEDVVGKGDYEYALPFYRERRPMLANLILMPAEEFESQYSHVEREGDTLVVDTFVPLMGESGRYFWAKASPLYDEAGEVVGAIESVRDITERRKMEARLARSQAELQIAADIQQSFLPKVVPQLGGFDICGCSVMAAEVGGDFFDVIPFEVVPVDEGKLGVLIADVCGKGVPAALFMALSRIVVRVSAMWHADPAEAIFYANDVIAHDAQAGMFVTLFFGTLCQTTRELTYVNAGHNSPMVHRGADGSIEELTRTGVALGAAPGRGYTSRSIVVGEGDAVVMYTDGVTEATDANLQLFGEERLRRVVRESGSRSAGEIVEAILADVRVFTGEAPQFDDITLLVIKGV
jgi:PAS domain S-box-containing protein